MYLSTLIVIPLAQLALSSALHVRAQCNADNCARAVTGTSPGISPALTVRKSDCSSFLASTVTPAPITTTIIVTVTANGPSKRSPATTALTSTPLVPAYASACSGGVRYSSACSCFNVSATTTTLPPSTVISTVITTITPTPSTSCSNPGVCGSYTNCGSSDTCFCGKGAPSGPSFCFADELCDGAQECAEDTDCTNASYPKCLLNSCCVTGVCVAVDTCANPAKKKMFVKKSDGTPVLKMTGWSVE